MIHFVARRWFLFALALVLVVGIGASRPLSPLASIGLVRDVIVASVLFVMALPVEAGAMWRSLKRPAAPLLAIGVTFGLLPAFTWLLSFGLSEPVALGMYIAAATPCTMASVAVWTRRAGGNDAAAVLVTIVTNASCFLVTPLWLGALTGKSLSDDALNVGEMIVELFWLVVLPMAVAQMLRIAEPVRHWSKRFKTPLGIATQCGVLAMVFLGAIRTGENLWTGGGLPIRELLEILVAVNVVHTAMFFAGFWIARGLRLPREDRIAVGFAGSQKTLMIGLQTAIDLGITILPMVAYHVCQLLVDTLIADRLAASGERATRGGLASQDGSSATQTDAASEEAAADESTMHRR